MKKAILVAVGLFVFQSSVFAVAPKSKFDDLVGSTFVCPGALHAVYTFFPKNKYTMQLRGVVSRIQPISYDYDGQRLILNYIGVDGSQRTQTYEVMYLKDKGKLIMMEEDGTQRICDEQ